MSCFPCLSPRRKDKKGTRHARTAAADGGSSSSTAGARSTNARFPSTSDAAPAGNGTRSNSALSMSFKELATATQNFNESNLIGEGGFGKVFKGRVYSGQVVAIKQLNQDGFQGSKEFLVEVLMLIMLRHQNLVSLIGFCMDGDERLLVYEYMSKGCLERHLFDLPVDMEPLEWNTRIKIAVGAAKGLEYLHDVANPPVIYRDLKSANILLDDDFSPKLSDFGLAKLAPVGDKTHVSTRVMGTYGYCAPEYAMSGKLTIKSDIYSFGVVLLELITGRRAYDTSRATGEHYLTTWSRRYLNDKRRFLRLADPQLRGRFPYRSFYHLTVITSMCLQEQPSYRPIIRDIVIALEHVANQPYVPEIDGEVISTPSRSSPSPQAYRRDGVNVRPDGRA